MTGLFQRSIQIILQNQSPTGAYIASPNLAAYRYCWFRDGAFIAYAMDLVGEHESAYRFHGWSAAVINRRASTVRRAIASARRNEPLEQADILHTRYTVAGEAGDEDWPNFQLDGLGTWLWALEKHRRLSGKPLPDDWLQAANLAAAYLKVLWQHPCFDCWEEFPDKVHPHTVAAIFGGLQAHTSFGGANHELTLAAIKQFLFEKGVNHGHFVKYLGSEAVDASLVGLATPYRIVMPDDPVMRATVARIEATLRQEGGVHRYAADTYYGGGLWLLLAAWLGWYYAEIGDDDKALAAKKWVEDQADEQANLPEQIPTALNDPSFYQPWWERWGEIASPLLWSHAQYIILSMALSPQQ
jgi:GH15 family glucan-1,4-alpha-glucosidase